MERQSRADKAVKAKALSHEILLGEYYRYSRKGYLKLTRDEQESSSVIRAEIKRRMEYQWHTNYGSIARK